MNKKKHTHLSIGTRAYLLSIIPVITTAIILSSFLIYSHISDRRQGMSIKGQLLANNLVNKSEFEFYTGNIKKLNDIIKSAVGTNDILFITIYNNKDEIIAYQDSFGNNKASNQGNHLTIESIPHLVFYKTFQEDTHLTSADLLDDISLSRSPSDVQNSGYLKLGVNLENAYAIERKRILFGASITLAVVFIVALTSAVAVHSVINPIRQTSKVLEQIESGDLSVRSTIDFNDALGDLQTNINNMAHTLQENKKKQEEFTEELVASKRNAEVANSAKSNFLAMMSHELRTPMNGVFGMLEILENTHLDNEQKKCVNIAKNSGSHLLTIINDILDFSRIESGKFIIEKTYIKPIDLINTCIDGFRENINNTNITLEARYQSNFDQIEIETDPTRLQQILINLIGNAIKFTHEGHVYCNVSQVENKNNNATILIKIEDTGVGIDENHIEHIFNSFEQADSSTSRIYGGTGLGLAISKRLTELLGGSISVESKLGSGSTFTIAIPMSIRKTLPPSQPSIIKKEIIPYWNAKALIVEDNNVNQIITQGILKKYGLTVETVENGKLAVEMSSKIQYDIIFMDCQMPIMDGYLATQHIRSGAINAETPIIAITASALPEQKLKCFDAGMNDYLSKPIKQSVVLDILYKHLGNLPMST